jgi:hypothetical protein
VQIAVISEINKAPVRTVQALLKQTQMGTPALGKEAAHPSTGANILDSHNKAVELIFLLRVHRGTKCENGFV